MNSGSYPAPDPVSLIKEMALGNNLWGSIQSNGEVVLANFPSDASLCPENENKYTLEYHLSQEQQDNLRILLNQNQPTQLI
jgi:urate oxidase